MANLKVFISSTCYDLAVVRSKLQGFLISLGYDPVLSEYSDVLFDHRVHTHTSCIDEVVNCDMMILLIGSRFGGPAVPEALSRVDMPKLRDGSTSKWRPQPGKDRLSVTQLEVARALEVGMPVFTFVDERVMHEHHVYESNKENKAVLSQIVFPSIEKPDTAEYIFEFINFLRLRNSGNAVATFSRIDDIESHLRKQWSGLLQRLLNEQRNQAYSKEQAQTIQNQLEDLKAAILSSMQSPARIVARGVIKFRSLIEFVSGFMLSNLREIVLAKGFSWNSFCEAVGIEYILRPRPISPHKSEIAFVLRSGTVVLCLMPFQRFVDLTSDFAAFAQENEQVREAILDAWTETSYMNRIRVLRAANKPISELVAVWTQTAEVEEYSVTNLLSPSKVWPAAPVEGYTPSDPGDDDIPF